MDIITAINGVLKINIPAGLVPDGFYVLMIPNLDMENEDSIRYILCKQNCSYIKNMFSCTPETREDAIDLAINNAEIYIPLYMKESCCKECSDGLEGCPEHFCKSLSADT